MVENPKAAETQRHAPATASGEAWRPAERYEQLAQTGDTPSGLIFKSMIGTAMVIAVPPAVVWLLFALVRWFVL
jgi:hypothetical protein